MRFVAVLSVFLAANAFAQDLDINGYSKVVIPRSEGDLADYNAALGAAVRDVGFELHRSAREIPDEARPRTLYMTAGLASFSDLSIYVVIYDMATDTRIAICIRTLDGSLAGRGSMVDRPLQAAMQDLLADLAYRGFDQSAYEANLRARAEPRSANEQSASPPAPTTERLRMSCGATTASH